MKRKPHSQQPRLTYGEANNTQKNTNNDKNTKKIRVKPAGTFTMSR
ncbi:MAG: hypothetical protein GQ557_01430 [Mycoplasmataceae bacterium]|nr:hypothetical protein [Mycoplasmataceae bacterium]